MDLRWLLGLLVVGCSGQPAPTPSSIAAREESMVANEAAPPAAEVHEAPATSEPTPVAAEAVGPQDVLDGTDVLPLASLTLVPLEVSSLAGVYRAEQGGSEATLTVGVHDGELRVARTFREPESGTARRSYVLQVDGEVARSPDAALRRTSEGVIFWEQSSGEEGIPAAFWFHYLGRGH